MPKSSNHLALARQWEMLKKIPARPPGITASALREWLKDQGFAVSKRTVERDLIELSAIFGICCNDVSIPYGWHWIPGKQYEFGSIEITDAVSLKLAEDLLRKMMPSGLLQALEPKFEQAKRKLDALDTQPYAKWTKKVRFVPNTIQLIPPRVEPTVLDKVHEALLKEVQIWVRYTAFNSPEAKNQRLHPLCLVQRGTVPYLVATAFDFEDICIYAMHRIESVDLTEEKAVIPKGFSVDGYIQQGGMEFGSGEEIQLKAWVTNELAIYLSETPLSKDQKIVYRENQWQLQATVHDSWQLHFWILSQGASMTVVSPKNLRNRIAEELESALSGYKGT
jgi:predicted DNA-binding transcriptional regulator YafY